MRRSMRCNFLRCSLLGLSRLFLFLLFWSGAQEADEDVLLNTVFVFLVETALKGSLVEGGDGEAAVFVDPGQQLVGADIVLLVLVNLVVK